MMMVLNGCRPSSTDVPVDVKRLDGHQSGGAWFASSSPPVFGDIKEFTGLKVNANKPLIINEGGLLMKKQTVAIAGKGKGIMVEKILDKVKLMEKPLAAKGETSFSPSFKNEVISTYEANTVIISSGKDDGKSVKLNLEKVQENSKKLDKSLVVKIFGNEVSFSSISYELRRQWSQYGKFHLTMLGKGWLLCSFCEPENMEAVLTNGPWFVNGNIVGLDRWSHMFDPNSLKGISAPIWIRMPNLPLHCWDEISICRIASMVGSAYLIDGNMFQWSRREFHRVCVRISLDAKLPTGVWVERENDKFFERIEYERLANLCFECGKIRHGKNECSSTAMEHKSMLIKPVMSDAISVEDKGTANVNRNLEAVDTTDKDSYGPWILENKHNEDVTEMGEKQSGSIAECNEVSKINVQKDSNFVIVKNCFNVLVALEEGELIPNADAINIEGDSHNSQGKEDPSIITDEKEKDITDTAIGEELKTVSAGNADSAISIKKRILKQLRELGPINSTSRSRRLEKEGRVGDLKIQNKGRRVATVYGSKEVHDRRELWGMIDKYASNEVPWVIGGDFNYIMNKEDKIGGRRFLFSQGPKEMKECLLINVLFDVGFIGPKFTWCNNKSGGARILERLDRCFINTVALSTSIQLIERHLAKGRRCILYGWSAVNSCVDNEEQILLEDDLTWKEMEDALDKMKGNAAPGIEAIFRDNNGRFPYASGRSCTYWDIAQLELLAIHSLKVEIKDWMFKYKGIIIEGDNSNVISYLQKLKRIRDHISLDSWLGTNDWFDQQRFWINSE
ncbi:hypothetical protein KFK09_017723 [Dendrobium nobile]|uniref:DUF4283 domain-containing protein n=1 Tax=Dendrobium nobile TaxID=94219 RepID=A0A8T3AT94_DENNO|nr:hypothetical protein KFK09_017723 [Dendrobium nobile]